MSDASFGAHLRILAPGVHTTYEECSSGGRRQFYVNLAGLGIKPRVSRSKNDGADHLINDQLQYS